LHELNLHENYFPYQFGRDGNLDGFPHVL
jgi:hypothetical protein